MVTILDEAPSFSSRLGTALGGGIGGGLQRALELAVQKKIEMGPMLKRGAASIPQHLRGKQFSDSLGIQTGKSTGDALRGTEQGVTVTTPTTGTKIPTEKGATPSGTKIGTGAQEVRAEGTQQSIMSPQQMQMKAAQRTEQKINEGVPTDFETELNQIRQENQDVAAHQAVQETAGIKAEEALAKVYPEATDEHKAIMKRKAEQLSEMNLSPAEIDRRLAMEAKKFANTINSVKRSLPPKRFYTRIKESFLGKGRSAEKARESVKLKVKPLLDDGLYDTARNLLSEKGYGPEEREEIVSSLGENTKKNLSSYERVSPGISFYDKTDPSYRAFSPGSNKQKAFKQNISQVLKDDPSTNLILLRKAYEDKGVDWSNYKDSLDELMSSGEFVPNDDQLKQLDILDEPPLDRLDRMLYKLDLIGR